MEFVGPGNNKKNHTIADTIDLGKNKIIVQGS